MLEPEPTLTGVPVVRAGVAVVCTGMLPKRRNELPLRVAVGVPVVALLRTAVPVPLPLTGVAVVPLPLTGVPVVALPLTGVPVVALPLTGAVPPTPVALVGIEPRSVAELRTGASPWRADEEPPREAEPLPVVAPPPLVELTP